MMFKRGCLRLASRTCRADTMEGTGRSGVRGGDPIRLSGEPSMKLPWLTAIATVAPLLAPARAPAQPLFHHVESIECTVTNADTVVVGLATRVGPGSRPL